MTGKFVLNVYSADFFGIEYPSFGTPYRTSFLLELQKIWVSQSGLWGLQWKTHEVKLSTENVVPCRNGFAFIEEEEVSKENSPLVDWFV